MNTITRTERMRTLLQAALTPTQLDIIDEGAAHVGHAGAQSGAGHFAVRIASPHFQDKKLLECHRLVYQALGDMMTTDIHALRIEII